jgi:hypothetical protein
LISVPNIDEFRAYTQKYVVKVLEASKSALKEGSDGGAEYMRTYIEADSPTGTPWHKRKNDERGNDIGARKDTGAMLNAVTSTGVVGTKKLSTNFGWVTNKKHYFAMQDSGGYWHTAYGKPSGIGMGLLNKAEDGGGRGTIRVLGAYFQAQTDFIAAMKKAGFRETDGKGGELF